MFRPRRLLALILLAGMVMGADAGDSGRSFELYLVRHAEKTPHANDPGLTGPGLQRARRLAHWLADKRLATLWSSDYRRSLQTAEPAASRLHLDIELYDPRALEAFADTLLERGQSALVVGHSNTTPELASLLCQCEVTPMSEEEHDRIIIITVRGHQRSIQERDQGELTAALTPP